MFRSTIALALAAIAYGQVEVSSDTTEAGNQRLLARRQVVTDITDFEARINVNLANAVADAQLGAERSAFNATVVAMAATNTQVQAMVSTINALQATVEARIANVESTAAAQASTLREDIEDEISSQIADVTTANNALRSSLTATLATVSSGVAAQISASAASTTVANRALTSTVAAQLASKADAETYMWTGGCTNTRHGGNWQEYCLNQAHVNKPGANPTKFTKSNTRFRATNHGYFNLAFWSIYRTCSWQRSQIHMDSRSKHYGMNRGHPWEGGHSWRDWQMEATYPVHQGREMWMLTYSDCWEHYHSTNSNGHHSRITLLYLGPWNGQ
jgi:uncharacterized coiled-coil protein SlyX